MQSPKSPRSEPSPLIGATFQNTPIEALRNLFVGFCQGLFAEAPPGSFHWDEDPQATEIIIQDESPTKEEVMHKRPLITLTRGPMQVYGFGLDDMVQYDAATGKKTKSVLIPGTMTVNCCSRVQIEAENIGWIVLEHIWALRDILIQNGLFDAGRNCQIGAPTPAGSIIAGDGGDEWTCVPVTVPFQFYRTTAVTPLNKPIIESIENRLSIGALGRVRNSGPPAPGHNGHLQVQLCPPGSITGAQDERGRTPNAGEPKPYFLPKQRHPLDPSQTVTVKSVRPYRPGLRPPHSTGVPFSDPCVEQS